MRRPSFLFLVLVSCLGCQGDPSPQPPPADTTAPAQVRDLAVASPAGRLITLTWTTPGDDGMTGQASRYEIRFGATPITEANWDSATAVASVPVPRVAGQPESLDVAGLSDGVWTFALRAADEVPNWSAISNVVRATVAELPVPNRVTDLAIVSAAMERVTLTWTAPGSDVPAGEAAEYDLRYSLNAISEGTWQDAVRVTQISAPGSAGTAESFTVVGPENGKTYYFALKAASQDRNWSALSNVVSATVADLAAPNPVTDLAIVWAAAERVTLTWTAPGSDVPAGGAAHYDLRYAGNAITEETWDAAARVPQVPAPATAGTAEWFTVAGLANGQTYHFALKAAARNLSGSALSNVVSATVTVSSLRRVTTNPSAGYGARMPTWSPDGTELVFACDWFEGNQIWKVPIAALTPVRLTSVPFTDCLWPSWSPVGGNLVFNESHPPPGPGELWIMHPTLGSQPVLLASHRGRQLSDRAAWSPDGTRVAYSVCPFWGPGVPVVSEIYSVPSGGGTPEPLITDPSLNVEPAWSPDGSRLAFRSRRSGNDEIWVMPLAGGNPVQLTDDPHWDIQPCWSPDGRMIAFASDRSGSYDIWVMSASGQSPFQLTFDAHRDESPVWSPDGKQIAFASDRTGSYEIWILSRE